MTNRLEDRSEDFVKLPYSVEVVPDETTENSSCYVASHPELPGCMSHGDTPDEAMTNLLEAKELYIRTLLKKGQKPPLPKSSPMVIWETRTEILPPQNFYVHTDSGAVAA